MARNLDDDAPNRTRAAEDRLREAEREIYSRERDKVGELRTEVRKHEAELARYRTLTRAQWLASLTALGACVFGLTWTATRLESPTEFVWQDGICALVTAFSTTVFVVSWRRLSRMTARHLIEIKLERDRERLRSFGAHTFPTIGMRRSLYREEVSVLVEQYQAEGRHYRRVHNLLQNLIIIGSVGTTTIAALDSGQQPTWQSLTLTAISFTITLAAAFTGYYKYRERSYFLQQTADTIDEEANAYALGIGRYKDFGPEKADQALAEFTARVEDARNEQRRRQQQLDQPAEQGGAPDRVQG